MPTVDSKGRIILPEELRERLGISPGSEIEIREEGGKAVVEPKDDPEQIIDDLEGLVEDAPSRRERTPHRELDAVSKDHLETIERQASQTGEE